MGVIKKSSLFAIAFVGLFVCSARAQGTITVKVPFPFVVDHQEFPAGQYDVREVENAGTVLSIEGVNHKLASFVLTMNAGGDDPAGDEPSLVFTRYENQYQLSEVWESRTVGRELRTSSDPHKTARSETQTEPNQVMAQVITASWK